MVEVLEVRFSRTKKAHRKVSGLAFDTFKNGKWDQKQYKYIKKHEQKAR